MYEYVYEVAGIASRLVVSLYSYTYSYTQLSPSSSPAEHSVDPQARSSLQLSSQNKRPPKFGMKPLDRKSQSHPQAPHIPDLGGPPVPLSSVFPWLQRSGWLIPSPSANFACFLFISRLLVVKCVLSKLTARISL